ncbi:hypothetical protein [Pedobacter aquatilis]|uniref:hypothetical protein n=1 Tax=Pedobacter aquatilis TaxID=351343 RepID=UPI00292FB6AD|nr:hypothetical protein [Pedobacter aquatilis]
MMHLATGEVSSFIGSIGIFNGSPAANSNLSVTGSDGLLGGGHLLELSSYTIKLVIRAELPANQNGIGGFSCFR